MFDKINQIVARKILSDYTYFNKLIYIHTDDSNFRLGAVISQEGKPISFYSIKLARLQKRYIATETSLLSIVETLK